MHLAILITGPEDVQRAYHYCSTYDTARYWLRAMLECVLAGSRPAEQKVWYATSDSTKVCSCIKCYYLY